MRCSWEVLRTVTNSPPCLLRWSRRAGQHQAADPGPSSRSYRLHQTHRCTVISDSTPQVGVTREEQCEVLLATKRGISMQLSSIYMYVVMCAESERQKRASSPRTNRWLKYNKASTTMHRPRNNQGSDSTSMCTLSCYSLPNAETVCCRC